MMVKSNLFKREKETTSKTFLHYCPDVLCLYLQPLIFNSLLTPQKFTGFLFGWFFFFTSFAFSL